jgi:hypothetical protein
MKTYSHEQLRTIEECFLPEHKEGVRDAFEALGWLLDQSPAISFASDPGYTVEHPAYKAIVALGELALLPLLKRFSYREEEERGCGWELMAAEEILEDLGYWQADTHPPEEMRGRVFKLRKFYRVAIKKFMAPRIKEYKRILNGKCACGKKGKWISDGICRTGYYCTKCSNEAIRNA